MYPKIALNCGPDSRRRKGRIVVLCNPCHNAEAGTKDKQDWIVIFSRGAKIKASASMREQGECEAKLARGKYKEERAGKKPGGRPPSAPSAEPKAKDQIGLTDEDSRIMPNHGGFAQS